MIGKDLKYTGWIGVCLLLLVGFAVKGQSWEEAGMQAARENKLVFVAAGVVPDKKIFTIPEIRNFFTKNAVAIQMDMQTSQGKAFEPRLWMNPYPVYAFFMPFGDLLTVVDPEKVAKNPRLLMDAGMEALKLAEVKRTNSRSVLFDSGTWPEVLDKAKQEDKPVFVYLGKERCGDCMQVERNVFRLDRVADFYNRNFISRIGGADLAEKYGVSEYPAFLFVNGDGKLLYKAEGKADADTLLRHGEVALEKMNGIAFSKRDAWQKVLERAEAEGKLIFADYYVSKGGERRNQAAMTFRDPDVAAFFNEHFVNFSRDTSFTALLFTDVHGKVLHRLAEIPDARRLLEEGKRVAAGRGMAAMQEAYLRGERNPAFIEEYIGVLGRAGMMPEANDAAVAYLSGMSPEQLKEKKYWELFEAYVTDAGSDVFYRVYSRKGEFYPLYGKENTDRKINSVWAAGAGRFVSRAGERYVFDEAGFKEYVKLLKKEKVEGWRSIARNARMSAAEKQGDWKTFVELAEEKWMEEQVPDAEMYVWGVKINEGCKDKSIRYKAARWFALAAAEMERRERISGKLRPSSYKGFFEKLVSDLTQ